jgi:hypothetical protein
MRAVEREKSGRDRSLSVCMRERSLRRRERSPERGLSGGERGLSVCKESRPFLYIHTYIQRETRRETVADLFRNCRGEEFALCYYVILYYIFFCLTTRLFLFLTASLAVCMNVK